MELLRDDGKGVLPKDFLGPHHRVERTESGVVQHDAFDRHSVQQQRVAHHGGLVVVLRVVVTADEDVVNLAGIEQLGCSNDAMSVVEIVCASRGDRVCAQQQAHTVVWDGIHVVVGSSMSSGTHGDVAGGHQRQACYA